MGIAFIVIGFLLIGVSVIFSIADLQNKKKKGVTELTKKDLRSLILLAAACGVGGLLTNIGYSFSGNWNPDAGHWAMLIIGGFLFYASVYAFAITFYLRYWWKSLPEEQKKYNGLFLILSGPMMLLTFILAGEGMAPYLTYPLVKGFAINGDGFTWTTPIHEASGGLNIPWYGVLIVAGAFLAYKLSDNNFYKKYGKHGILDSIFLIAFPAGILCARLWYVVGNWNGDGQGGVNFAEEVAAGRWWRIFAIWEGGLTILGGAVGGILVGSLFFIFRRRYSDLRFAFDAVVPNILLAQAIGRFGNFFNHEVYGKASDMSAWPLVPTWIKYNMATGWANGMPISTQMYAPMFLIEAVLNVLGFFVIVYLIPLIWRKGRALGNSLSFYLIWYGVVRIIMEPMRDPSYNMGKDGSWSVWNAMVYIILGVVALIALQTIAYFRKKKGLPVEMGTPPELLAKQAAAAEKEEEPAPSVLPTKKAPSHKNDFAKPKAIPHGEAKPEEPKEEASESGDPTEEE